MTNRNFQRLTVHLNNLEHKKDFQTTYTYKDIPNEQEARRVVRAMHLDASDSNQDMMRKIKKAVYNGKELLLHSDPPHTSGGWIIK